MDPVSVSEQIERILRSQAFANKSQLKKLLEILHKRIDSQATLKPDQVIKELWPEETRTKGSAHVATEMNRLRRALEIYYGEEGRADSILIILPSRSLTGDGTHGNRWIEAKLRGSPGDHAPIIVKNSPRVLRIAGSLAAACAALGIVAYLGYRLLATHDQPRLGRLDGSMLVVMDTQGRELWRKRFPQGFGPDSYYAQGLASRFWFADLEGEGHTSVLFSYTPAADSQPHSSTLICYSDRGKEKWRWTPRSDSPEAGRDATYKTLSLGILKATQKRPAEIVVVSDRDPWWGGPCQVALIDANGKPLSVYWHAGGLHDVLVRGPDANGKQDIIVTGVARGYDSQATMVVLDADRVFGASKETQPEFQIHDKGEAQEKLRLLFPRSDLNRASFQYNYGAEPTFQNGNLQLRVLECLAPVGCPIRYEFNEKFQLIAVDSGGDEFKSAHDRFYQNGKDAHSLGAEEQAAFLKIQCLVGCNSKFVPVAETSKPAASFENGWNSHSNPNGVWSYGFSSGFTSPITLYDKTLRNGINGPNAQFWISTPVNAGTSPSAEYNNGPAYNDGNIDFLTNEFLLVAGIHGQYSNLIFTAPADGEYSVAGSFRGAQYGIGTVVGVAANEKMIVQSSMTSVDQLVPFDFTLDLQTGNTVVFSVGPGQGTQNTGLSVTITRPCAPSDRPAPVPSGEIACSGRAPGK